MDGHRRSDRPVASLLRTGSGIRQVPGVMEPALEFLKLFVYLAQNALNGSERRVSWQIQIIIGLIILTAIAPRWVPPIIELIKAIRGS